MSERKKIMELVYGYVGTDGERDPESWNDAVTRMEVAINAYA